MLHDNLYIRSFFSVFAFYALLSKYAQYPEQRVQNFKPVTDLDCRLHNMSVGTGNTYYV